MSVGSQLRPQEMLQEYSLLLELPLGHVLAEERELEVQVLEERRREAGVVLLAL